LPTDVRAFLMDEGLLENEDFFIIHDFVPRYYWNKNKSLAVKTLDVACTTLCNMKCEACQTFIPMAMNPANISSEKVLFDIDLMFRYLDSVMNLNFAVGENLLNKELPDICNTVYEKYSGRYHVQTIQTNGIIMPEDDAMRRFSEAKAVFCISNYRENTQAAKNLVEKCIEHDILWYFNRAGGNRKLWFDFGDPRLIKETDPEKLRELYANCWKPGVGVYDGWLYLCEIQCWAHTVAKAGTLEPGDAFDLQQPKTEASCKELYRILIKHSDTGYISHCMRCNSVMMPYVKSH